MDEKYLTALVRGQHEYILVYTDRTRHDALRTIGRWASDPEMTFNWNDAARMSVAIQKGKVRA